MAVVLHVAGYGFGWLWLPGWLAGWLAMALARCGSLILFCVLALSKAFRFVYASVVRCAVPANFLM